MHPIDWSWSERVNCGGSIALSGPAPVPAPYFPSAVSSPSRRFQTALPATTSAVASSLKPAMVAAGRKRSRDESCHADDYDSSDISRGSVSPPKAPGFSRTNSYQRPLATSTSTHPHDAFLMSTVESGQTRNWADELSQRLRSSSVNEAGRPAIEARKSIRLDKEATDANEEFPGFVEPAHANSDALPDRDIFAAPCHDAASIALGVGWHVLSPAYSSDSLAAAIRGWTTFVESRFPLSSVKFEWGKKSDPKAYLVGAVSKIGRSPGYYLFQEDLQQGRLVAKSWERALDNLRHGIWESDELLIARDPSAWGAEVRGMEMGQAEPYVQSGMNVTPATDSPSMNSSVNGVHHLGHPISSAQALQAVGGGMDLD